MKIDLFKLNNFNRLDLDSPAIFPKEFYDGMEIRGIENCHVKGEIVIDFEDELMANLEITGTFILPCAITLEDVFYSFSTKMEENLGKFEDFYDKNKNSLDILPILWENIVTEVPIRVVKEGVSAQDLNGEGWEVISSE